MPAPRELGRMPAESITVQPVILNDIPAQPPSPPAAAPTNSTHMNGAAAAAAVSAAVNAAGNSGQLNETELQEAFRAQQQAEAHFAALRKDAEYAKMLQVCHDSHSQSGHGARTWSNCQICMKLPCALLPLSNISNVA